MSAKRLTQAGQAINQETLNELMQLDHEAEANKDDRKAGSPPNQV